jgi:predicted CopG family antitoxin
LSLPTDGSALLNRRRDHLDKPFPQVHCQSKRRRKEHYGRKKTITIDTDTYELLNAMKKPNESSTKAIKRRLRPARTARSLRQALSNCLLSEEALDRTEAIVRSRSDSPASSPEIHTEA